MKIIGLATFFFLSSISNSAMAKQRSVDCFHFAECKQAEKELSSVRDALYRGDYNAANGDICSNVKQCDDSLAIVRNRMVRYRDLFNKSTGYAWVDDSRFATRTTSKQGLTASEAENLCLRHGLRLPTVKELAKDSVGMRGEAILMTKEELNLKIKKDMELVERKRLRPNEITQVSGNFQYLSHYPSLLDRGFNKAFGELINQGVAYSNVISGYYYMGHGVGIRWIVDDFIYASDDSDGSRENLGLPGGPPLYDLSPKLILYTNEVGTFLKVDDPNFRSPDHTLCSFGTFGPAAAEYEEVWREGFGYVRKDLVPILESMRKIWNTPSRELGENWILDVGPLQ